MGKTFSLSPIQVYTLFSHVLLHCNKEQSEGEGW